uniref:Phosphatidylinositol transfer protein membrane associated 2 n=1 Tax=Eptatretus burgeri TaxID=7764 RepID=A0A8C4WVF6_EPTBU
MLIKEYRIPLPLSLEEYRIAQLYMIQKKSREETCGEGSGVEILENRPYSDGPGGSGQFTHKLYHIGMHIPAWFRSLLPKAALRVEEQAWNAYPYTRTRYTCPFVEKFSIDIETYYKPDAGQQHDLFNLSAAEKRQVTVDVIDIVRDLLPPHEYQVDEDPRLYWSMKTGRGPLSDNWISNEPKPIMCAYKLCKVEFRYWGMQSKIERFIHDVGLRKIMVRAHRQAWCWQDEWYGLTIEDIRQLERETQLALAHKMAQYTAGEDNAKNVVDSEDELDGPQQSDDPLSTAVGTTGIERREDVGLAKQWSASSRSSRSSKRGGSPSNQSLCEWRMQSIAHESEGSSDEEFFDTQEDLSDGEDFFLADIAKWSSSDIIDQIGDIDVEGEATDLFVSELELPDYGTQTSVDGHEEAEDVLCQSMGSPPCKTHVLALLLHGGTILDGVGGDPASKQGDLNTFAATFDSVVRAHFPAAMGHLTLRLVPCPPVCADAFSLVSNLSPYSVGDHCVSNNCHDHVPLAALPLLATSTPQYQECVAAVISRTNQAYHDFLKSSEAFGFNGQVCLIGDCVGGILAFDALCASVQATADSQNSSRRGSLMSVQDTDLLAPGIVVNRGSPGSSGSRDGTGNGGATNAGGNLSNSRQMSKSNIDIPHAGLDEALDSPRKEIPRKRSDSSTYELEMITQHQTFLSSLRTGAIKQDETSCPSSSSAMLDGTTQGKLDFEASDVFLFGSPLGLVLAMRRMVIPNLDVSALRPNCQQLHNLFHPADPSTFRLEPLLERRFHRIPPCSVPRYQQFPLGDGLSIALVESLQRYPFLVMESLTADPHPAELILYLPIPNWQNSPSDAIQSLGSTLVEGAARGSMARAFSSKPTGPRRGSDASITSQFSGVADGLTASNVTNITAKWWGNKRLDFALYCPDALMAFPTGALPHLFHASYWESKDVAAFILRQILQHENIDVMEHDGGEIAAFSPGQAREKWLRRRTQVKLRNVTANHRASDVVVMEDCEQVVTGRFMYGPLDMVTLAGEKVDIHIMTKPPAGEWVYFGTEVTNSSGRLTFLVPTEHRLAIGMYPVKMVIRGDHTYADSSLAVLPRGTEGVVFSIDGSFAASVSIMGSDPKVRAGAVDVVRHWQDLGYLIVYVTGRPDMQKQRVVAWLAQHNFPHGIVSFCDGLVHDPLRHKASFLRSLAHDKHLRIHAAYGSSKDIAVYGALGLPPNHIYIVGRSSRKYLHQCQFISDGYASHLAHLECNQRSRPAKRNARMILRKGSFGLPGCSDALRKRTHLRRTVSVQQTVSANTSPVAMGVSGGVGAAFTGRRLPERTQSQSEGDVERVGRSLSFASSSSYWGGKPSGSGNRTRFESVV